MNITITKDDKGLFTIETATQKAERLMWHEMIALVCRMTEPSDKDECFAWLREKDLFD